MLLSFSDLNVQPSSRINATFLFQLRSTRFNRFVFSLWLQSAAKPQETRQFTSSCFSITVNSLSINAAWTNMERV